MTGGPPMRVASSRPRTLTIWKLPSSRRALRSPLYRGTAHSTPVMPRTRMSSVSCIGLTSSMNCTLGSMTQMSGWERSLMKL